VSTGLVRLIAARPGLRLAGLILVLAGLFGMHGLGGHDAAAMGSVPQAGMAEIPMSAAAAAAGLTAAPSHQIEQVGTQGHPDTHVVGASGPGGMGMGMTAMCVAILAAGLIALVRFLLGGRLRSVLWMLARHTRAVLQHLGRAPDPPSLIALSIQRC
jgi:hypothetical protein